MQMVTFQSMNDQKIINEIKINGNFICESNWFVWQKVKPHIVQLIAHFPFPWKPFRVIDVLLIEAIWIENTEMITSFGPTHSHSYPFPLFNKNQINAYFRVFFILFCFSISWFTSKSFTSSFVVIEQLIGFEIHFGMGMLLI